MVANSAADCLYLTGYYRTLIKERWSVTASAWYCEPNERSPHPGVLPYKRSQPEPRRLNYCQHDGAAAGLDPAGRRDLGLVVLVTVVQSIPVVTFLAPLASNFEGLKDR